MTAISFATRVRPLLARALAAVLCVVALTLSACSARSTAGHPAPGPSARAGAPYLALGDSVAFGYREPTNAPPPDYRKPNAFIGYPEDVAADLSLRVANAACPGETSASLIDAAAPSNGCEASAAGLGYRALFPLHVAYRGSQLDFAVRFLNRHHDTRLVSLMIGANDGFRCQDTTADHCARQLPALLRRIGSNVARILGRIRHAGHYAGQIVVVNYYSRDYADPAQNRLSRSLNAAVDAAAGPFDVQVADGFAAFRRAAAQAHGRTCAAGLLTTLSGGGCGVHPSVAGQAVLAGAVERVVRPR